MDVNGKRKEIPVSKLPTEHSNHGYRGKNRQETTAESSQPAKSIVVSGPMGVYENKEFNYGTKTVFRSHRKQQSLQP
jgi:3-phosphoglycerate kinase